MIQTHILSDKEQTKLYSKVPKKKLIEMLIQANKEIDKLIPQDQIVVPKITEEQYQSLKEEYERVSKLKWPWEQFEKDSHNPQESFLTPNRTVEADQEFISTKGI